MTKVSFLKNNKLGDGFVQENFFPKGENEYYIRNKQVNATEKHWRNLTNDEISIHTAVEYFSDPNHVVRIINRPYTAAIHNDLIAQLFCLIQGKEVIPQASPAGHILNKAAAAVEIDF